MYLEFHFRKTDNLRNMLLFILVPCYLQHKLLILTGHDYKINGKQLLINNFGITTFQQKCPHHLRKHVNNIYIHLKE